MSPSLSPSLSPSISPSISPSLPAITYSKGDYVALPSDDTDLETAYTETEVDDVATKNDVRVGQDASGEYSVHLYKDAGIGNQVNLEWEGQSTLAPSASEIFLQIYNRDSTTWETLTSDNSSPANTDFSLIASVNNLVNYKDGDNLIACRIYQLML